MDINLSHKGGGSCEEKRREEKRREEEMEKALRAYAEVLRLVRLLPKDSRAYYAKYARENFVNYRQVDPSDFDDLFQRTYNHSLWVLHKYSIDKSAADKLKGICCT